MKYIKSFILTSVFALSVASCDDMGFLRIKPDDLVLTEDTLTTPAHLQKFMVDAYREIRTAGFLGGEMLVAQDVMSGDAVTLENQYEWTQVSTYTTDLFNAVGNSGWGNTYATINRANFAAFSSKADEILANADPAIKTRLEADASFIRGLGHFHLVRIFGLPYDESTKNIEGMGVPLRLRGTVSMDDAFTPIQRSTLEETYTQIITDLTFAANNLPEGRAWNDGFATRDAANAMLAKAYFYKGDMANAVTAADKVINKYTLDADMKAKFARASSEGTTTEVIFMIPSTGRSNDSWGAIRARYRSDDPASSTRCMPSTDMYNLVSNNNNDTRFDAFFKEENGTFFTTKFDYDNMDCIVIALNELLLIYAEAAANSNKEAAVAALNQIESRAYGAPQTSTTASANQIIEAAQKERRIELAFQGERTSDLKRQKKNVNRFAWSARELLFEIPAAESNGNPDIIKNKN